jgi:hypothetical protein
METVDEPALILTKWNSFRGVEAMLLEFPGHAIG